MKILLIFFTAFLCGSGGFAQENNIQKLLKGYKLQEKRTHTAIDSLKVFTILPDSIKANTLLQRYKNIIPNLLKPFPNPKLVGNNGNGQNIYILALDKMPMIRPDSNFSSNMPVTGDHNRFN